MTFRQKLPVPTAHYTFLKIDTLRKSMLGLVPQAEQKIIIFNVQLLKIVIGYISVSSHILPGNWIFNLMP